jgi:hypothetical protein
MMDYMIYLGGVLTVLGLPMQYLRGRKAVSESWTYILAVLLASGGYALCHVFGPDWRLEIIQGLIALVGNTGCVLGGTFVASGSAKAGLAVFPVTNSK